MSRVEGENYTGYRAEQIGNAYGGTVMPNSCILRLIGCDPRLALHVLDELLLVYLPEVIGRHSITRSLSRG